MFFIEIPTPINSRLWERVLILISKSIKRLAIRNVEKDYINILQTIETLYRKHSLQLKFTF